MLSTDVVAFFCTYCFLCGGVQCYRWSVLMRDPTTSYHHVHYANSGVTGWINDERRNQELVDALPAIPLNRLLIETDAPYLSPNRKKIRRNEPCYLPLIAEKIASVLGISREMVVEQSTRNAQELFSL